MRPHLKNLTIADCGQQLIKVLKSDDGNLENSVLQYTDHAPSTYTNGIDVLTSTNWVVRDNKFIRIRGPQNQLSGAAILFWQGCKNTLIERNLILECSKGIALGLSSGLPVKDENVLYDHQRSIVRNNMIVRLTEGDCAIEFNYADDFKCYHNSVYIYSTIIDWAIEYRFSVTNGIIVNNLTNKRILSRDGARAILKNNISHADASWFIDVQKGDLHLTDDAIQTIDKAMLIKDIDDFDKQQRPIGKASDIGADEKQLETLH